MIPMAGIEKLSSPQEEGWARLQEYDAMLARHANPAARNGDESSFDATPKQLGKAAVSLPVAVPRGRKKARIYVLAGVNGAGKSSVGGRCWRLAAGVLQSGRFAAREVRQDLWKFSQEGANARAWKEGLRLSMCRCDRRTLHLRRRLAEIQ